MTAIRELSDEALGKLYEDAKAQGERAQAVENACGDELSYRAAKAALDAKVKALETSRAAALASLEPDQEPV